MKQRHQQLLHLLARQEWIKGRELASCLGVSARTVRSDIEQINREMPAYHSSGSPKKDITS